MKRFWDSVAVEPTGQGHVVLLDGKPMRLPGGARLEIGPERLAEAIAEEWRLAGGGKGGEMSFKDTPLTRLAGTALERIAPDPAPTVDAIARYGETDLLCYRAAAPAGLVHRQHELWQPWLDWVALTHDAPLRITTGVGYVKQHRDSITALRSAVGRLDADALAALGIAVPSLGSLVLGLAMAARVMDAETAYTLGTLDELYQAEQWGDDDEAVARRTSMLEDVTLAARYIDLTRGDR